MYRMVPHLVIRALDDGTLSIPHAVDVLDERAHHEHRLVVVHLGLDHLS